MPSILSAFEERDAHLRAADQVMRKLATELSELVPPSMRGYAEEMSWYPSMIGGREYWKLPEFLQHLVSNTRAGGCNDDKFRQSGLEDYGFKSFKELETAMTELGEAWKGLVRIRISKESGRRTVRFYAAEIIPKNR